MYIWIILYIFYYWSIPFYLKIIYHKQFLRLICPNNPLSCHRQRTVGYSGHFDRKTRSLCTLQDIEKKYAFISIIIFHARQ